MKNKFVDKLFLGVFLIILVGGGVKSNINPLATNEIENRPAYQIPLFNVKNYLTGTYQSSYELALADQIPLANKMKLFKKSSDLFIRILYENISNPILYKQIYDGIYIIDDYLVYGVESLAGNKSDFDKKINNINSIANSLENIDFYLYYIEKDIDIDFESNVKSGAYEYIKDNIDSKIKSSKLAINNLEEYKSNFYKTDHHWNHRGSYQGYLDLLDLMNIDEKPIINNDEVCMNGIFNGSKGRSVGGIFYFREKLCAYKYKFPNHKTYINNLSVDSYGGYDTIMKNNPKQISYGWWYGGDNGLVQFEYNRPESSNLLIIGDSFDNAINELLASHFNNTFIVDLRDYEYSIGSKFNIAEFTKRNNINKVLLIGSAGFYASDINNLEEVK